MKSVFPITRNFVFLCLSFVSLAFVGCSSENFVANNSSGLNGLTQGVLLNQFGGRISGATVYIPGTSGPTAQTFLGLSDANGTCPDTPNGETGGCTNADGEYGVSCNGSGNITLQAQNADGDDLGTFTGNCGGGSVVTDLTDPDASGAGGTFTPGPIPDTAIRATVTGVTAGHACEGLLFAVSYTSFNSKSGEVQTQLFPTAGDPTTYSGDVFVGFGVTSRTVYIYCDTSTGINSYDTNSGGGVSTDMFSNTAQFNACPRTMDPVTSTPGYTGSANAYLPSTVYGYYYSNASTTTTTTPSTPMPSANYYAPTNPLLSTSNATAGDPFASAMDDAGMEITVAITDLVALGGGAHPNEGGTLSQWCNCILGPDHSNTFNSSSLTNFSTYQYYYSYPYYTSYTYWFWGFNVYISHIFNTSFGFFTDTNRTSDSSSGSCILP